MFSCDASYNTYLKIHISEVLVYYMCNVRHNPHVLTILEVFVSMQVMAINVTLWHFG